MEHQLKTSKCSQEHTTILLFTTRMKRLFITSIVILTKLFVVAQSNDNVETTLTIAIPEVAIMDIESVGSKNITLALETPTEAGSMVGVSAAVDSSLWLNYSSVTGKKSNASRKIYVRMASGSIPNGLRLRVTPLNYSGSGDGNIGVSSSPNGRVINRSDRLILKNINTCYTGDGTGNGHQLVYKLEYRKNQYHKIKFDQSNTVTIIYTITDN